MPNWYRYAKRQARYDAGVHYEGMGLSHGQSHGHQLGEIIGHVTPLNEWWKEAPNGRKCALCANNAECTRSRTGNHAGCWERILTEEEQQARSKEIERFEREIQQVAQRHADEQAEADKKASSVATIVFAVVFIIALFATGSYFFAIIAVLVLIWLIK